MTIKERVDGVIERFESANPHPQTALHYGTPYQFLVAVLLSAQCTDERINMVTPALFAAYPSPLEMSRASEEEILTYIRSVTYPNSKARYLKQSAESIVQDYSGTVPETLKELMSLQGVGRKTANVYLSVIIGEPRIGVDTHVYRVSRRIGLVPQTANNVLKVEESLLRRIPRKYWNRIHHWLILHGRQICFARNPHCLTCPISDYCRHYARRYDAGGVEKI